MKKLLLFTFALLPLAASADDSGKCGENVYYFYDSATHTLTIYGEGAMWNLFDASFYPWWSFGDDIQHIGIESGVTSIEREAFVGCSGLTSITLPESLNYVNEYAFEGCKSLEAVYISDLEAYLKIVFAFDDNPSNPLYYAHHLFLNGKELVDLVIPDGITAIYNYSFVNCSSLKSVHIPNSVTSIGERAFDGCNGLTSITIPSSVTRIGTGAFSGYSITSMKVESGNRVYDSRSSCNAIIETASNTLINGCKTSFIPNSVTSIGNSAFNGCSGLTSITIPNSVTNIGSGAFSNCSDLSSITIPNSVTNIGNGAFEGTAWYNNQPDGLVYAGKVAYKYKGTMPANTSLSLKDGTLAIASNAFRGCSGLSSITIPNSLTSIGSWAFDYCSSLTSVTIPNSVKTIDNDVFYGCSDLTSIISEITKPFVISDVAFSGNPDFYKTATLTVPAGTKNLYQSTSGWNKFQNIVEADFGSANLSINGINYHISSESDHTILVSKGDYGQILEVPATITYGNNSWNVIGLEDGALDNCEYLAAVIWGPKAQFNANVNNPNMLLYVSDEKYASRNVRNVVVNNVAQSIELTDASDGNDFYCPRAFTARKISYSHHYNMETGLGDSKGWETIVLPFDVQNYTHATKGEIEPFTTWTMGSNKKPFWLFELTAGGYKDVAGIKANTPYIISMPNNRQYEQQYQIPGVVTFSATNVEVKKSDDLKPVSYQGRTFVPNYGNKAGDDVLALNVNSYYVTNPGKETDGSKFIRGLRAVHPFEAYMTTTDGTRSIDVMDGMTTDIKGIGVVKDGGNDVKVYDIKGVLLKTSSSMDDARKGLKAGVYIVDGKKIIIK